MSNDYFKAQGWFKNYARSSEDSRGMFQRLVEEDEREFKLASAESDKLKEDLNKKLGSGTIKYGSEISQPPARPDVIEIDLFNDFMKRNPAAEGGAAKQLLAQPSVDGSRPGYATSTVKKGKFKYPVTNQMGTVYSDKKPKSSAAEIGSGKFSKAELNRVARIKYPKIGDYEKLDSKQKANVRSNLQYSSVAGSKITKKTFLTPLTEIQQNKILEEFPDADFNNGKFGFNTKTDQTKFVQVKKFIDRGYKPRFKSLPIKMQNQLKEKFSEVDNWDFKKYKYGVSMKSAPGEERKLGMRVKNFVAEPKPYMFGFSLDRPGAWMTQQMYRAWEHGNTDYEPKYNKNNKVIGMYEKGKLYYANKNVADIDGAKKAKLINSHPEFNKVQKFVDVANEAKLPLKDLTGYKNTKALTALFPEGFESIKFSDLTNYLYRNAGADVTRNAIEKHHLKNLSDMGAPVDSKNLQLLRQDLNTLGNTITQQIKEGDFSRVGDLEKAGVKITVDGKTYGKGFQDPRKQFNKIIGDVTEQVSSLDKKQFKQMIKEIESYITDRTGKVKQPMLPSGLAGAYEMLSDDLKAIVDSEGFKKFSNSKTGKTLSMAAKTPGKLFGIGDVLLGYLDYTNNKPMMSKAKAYQSMLQAMSFGIYRGGDKQNLKEIKQKFIANGGDGEIFDKVVDLNESNFDMMEYIENIKRSYKDLSGAGYEDIAKKQMKSALNNVKTMGEKNLDKFEQYKTDLAVSEAGSPIQIKDVMQPARDAKKAAFDLFEEEQIKNYPTTSEQVNTERGPIAEKIYNSILTKDSYKKLLPQNWLSTFNQMIPFMPFKPVTEKEKEAALIDKMEPRERYLYNLARGQDPDNPMTISETAKFMDKNKKAIGFSEGGITGLRSKYEYKK